jgi:hypothetical protein
MPSDALRGRSQLMRNRQLTLRDRIRVLPGVGQFLMSPGYVGSQSGTENVSVCATILSGSHGRRGIMWNKTVGVSYSQA